MGFDEPMADVNYNNGAQTKNSKQPLYSDDLFPDRSNGGGRRGRGGRGGRGGR